MTKQRVFIYSPLLTREILLGFFQGLGVMIVDLQSISRSPRYFDLTIQPSWWRESHNDEQIRGLEGSLSAKISVSRENKRYAVSGRVAGRLRVICDRCLETYPLAVSRDFQLLLSPFAPSEPVQSETELEKEDLLVGFIEAEEIDLDDIIREQIYLSLPMKLLCREDCAGFCFRCGINLNLTTCKCRKNHGHPAFLKLKDLKIPEGHSPGER